MERLLKWNKAKRAARKGENIDNGAALFGDWCPQYPALAEDLFYLVDSNDWHNLPDQGGFLDQDEGIMRDLTELSRMSALIMAQLEANESDT